MSRDLSGETNDNHEIREVWPLLFSEFQWSLYVLKFNTQQILCLPTQCIYVFSVDLLGAVCSNYRPITLLNMAYKIFTILLNNRLPKVVDSKLSEAQAGFRPNRSTLDNLFIIRQTFEKCREYNIDFHNIFVDYLHAFDSVNRNKVIDSLNEYNVTFKLIKLIALTLTGTSAIVKINSELNGKFYVQTGVKQGDPLSATLFSIAMDSILKKMEMRGNISTGLRQCTAYARDILITARTTQTMTDTFVKLKMNL